MTESVQLARHRLRETNRVVHLDGTPAAVPRDGHPKPSMRIRLMLRLGRVAAPTTGDQAPAARVTIDQAPAVRPAALLALNRRDPDGAAGRIDELVELFADPLMPVSVGLLWQPADEEYRYELPDLILPTAQALPGDVAAQFTGRLAATGGPSCGWRRWMRPGACWRRGPRPVLDDERLRDMLQRALQGEALHTPALSRPSRSFAWRSGRRRVRDKFATGRPERRDTQPGCKTFWSFPRSCG
ncbi:hypothetical protein [Kitasatospora indigofera]|uniref:hypothetical protein n=1 Tax=Kitasatospora indigofera TaxID=67307 RepID=UPI0033AB5DD4